MIKCFKHRTEYVNGKCPACEKLKQVIKYNTTNPEHRSKFIMDKLTELDKIVQKLKAINSKVDKLLKDNK